MDPTIDCERMLDKSISPSFEDMQRHTGQRGELWAAFRQRMCKLCPVQMTIRFPYGNTYGWSLRFGEGNKSNKHICDAFAEKDTFTVHFRVCNTQIGQVFDTLSDYSKTVWENKYPCNDGGWLSYRVWTDKDLDDVLTILASKLSKYTKRKG